MMSYILELYLFSVTSFGPSLDVDSTYTLTHLDTLWCDMAKKGQGTTSKENIFSIGFVLRNDQEPEISVSEVPVWRPIIGDSSSCSLVTIW